MMNEDEEGSVKGSSRVIAYISGADNAADLADNTLDMMVGRELKGDDFMSVNEMRDELYQCQSLSLIRLNYDRRVQADDQIY